MSFNFVSAERDGKLAIVTINRPKVNALTKELIDELRQSMVELKHDGAIRCIILTGAGEKAFVAGGDIGSISKLTPAEGKDHSQHGKDAFDVIEDLGKPVIAAVNGFALGGGCELAMACTLRIAADTARFGQPEIKLGIIPGYGGTQRLSRLVGKGRAMELVLTGRMIDADEALRIGLVNRVVPAPSLMEEARAWAHTLAAGPPIAIRFAMEAINKGLEMPLPEGLFLEATLFGLLTTTEDMREGTRAFLEKRQAEFKGR
jgi:enoyl-CoA hydratase